MVLIQSSDPSSRGAIADVRRTLETVQFHSPERLQTGQISPTDDAWALAGTLFAALTGVRPFGETRPEVERRIRQGLPHLSVFGLDDDDLYAVIGGALTVDLGRRTATIGRLRAELEQWARDPAIYSLQPLEDDDVGEEDQAATAMLPVESMGFALQNSATGEIAFEAESLRRQPASTQGFGEIGFGDIGLDEGSFGGPPSEPPGETDATVMRSLPAHIVAMAARAAGGSNSPVSTIPPTDDEMGGATRIAPAQNVASLLQAAAAWSERPPVPPAPPPPSGPITEPAPRGAPVARAGQPSHSLAQTQASTQPPAFGPSIPQAQVVTARPLPPPAPPPSRSGTPKGGPAPQGASSGAPAAQGPLGPPAVSPPRVGPSAARPPIQRALRATQLGVGMVQPSGPLPVAPLPSAPPAPQAAGPRPGFVPPKGSLSSAPPPQDGDDVHTVMHAFGTAGQHLAELARSPGAAPSRPGLPPVAPPARPVKPAPLEAPPEDDDDDQQRTVMRAAPGLLQAIQAAALASQDPPPLDASPGWGDQADGGAHQGPLGTSPMVNAPRDVGATGGGSAGATGPSVTEKIRAQSLDQDGQIAALLSETEGAQDDFGLHQGAQPHARGANPPAIAPPGAFPPPLEITGGFEVEPMFSNPNAPAGPFAPIGAGSFHSPNRAADPATADIALARNLGGPGGALDAPGKGNTVLGGALPNAPLGGTALTPPTAPGGPPARFGLQPLPIAEAEPTSNRGLWIVSGLILVLAAAITFLVLQFRDKLGF